jgi:hypothetical protein
MKVFNMHIIHPITIILLSDLIFLFLYKFFCYGLSIINLDNFFISDSEVLRVWC